MTKVVNNVLYMVLEMTYIHKNVIIYDKIERESPWKQNVFYYLVQNVNLKKLISSYL